MDLAPYYPDFGIFIIPFIYSGAVILRAQTEFKKSFCGGFSEEAFCLRAVQSPAALLVQSRTQQKSFLFLLPARRSLGVGGEEKNGRAQNKKLGRKLFCGTASEASRGGAERQSSQSGFSSKKVRILTKGHRFAPAKLHFQ